MSPGLLTDLEDSYVQQVQEVQWNAPRLFASRENLVEVLALPCRKAPPFKGAKGAGVVATRVQHTYDRW